MKWLYDVAHCPNRLSVILPDNNIIRLVRIFAPYALFHQEDGAWKYWGDYVLGVEVVK